MEPRPGTTACLELMIWKNPGLVAASGLHPGPQLTLPVGSAPARHVQFGLGADISGL